MRRSPTICQRLLGLRPVNAASPRRLMIVTRHFDLTIFTRGHHTSQISTHAYSTSDIAVQCREDRRSAHGGETLAQRISLRCGEVTYGSCENDVSAMPVTPGMNLTGGYRRVLKETEVMPHGVQWSGHRVSHPETVGTSHLI
ncbi:uncharacterized protein K489DRAFT_146384 [Dissoconium aciculare CBS 342.82]|uniref:Uncharacterized protein n=1 Tax=Dissoconium aciculare CBS 342.82 TaxID=1314786 RepID=A0A6J3MAE7_9PEZI|nr:uncharacterized protein K489DRAFT_146384 [Dissoconium aciculare CBS 342.82]KAF1825001.1 hypothetical protein K489DRAFT_146384 [Dissoconium aciculare CBS 342.82]